MRNCILKNRLFLIALIGFIASMLLLATNLPLNNVSALGQILTLSFYVLNPPFVVIQLFATHGAHELEESIWPLIQYIVAAFVSFIWWVSVYAYLTKRKLTQAQRKMAKNPKYE